MFDDFPINQLRRCQSNVSLFAATFFFAQRRSLGKDFDT